MDIIRRSVESTGTVENGVIPFVISSEEEDLLGDVIVQKGIQVNSDRIPAQVDHSGQVRDIIGSWRNIRLDKSVSPPRTTGELHLLPEGVSPITDLVRAISAAGVRLAASVGLRVGKREPIKGSKKGGIRYLETLLTEVSVVVVPANTQALQVVRSLLPDVESEERRMLEQLVRQKKERDHKTAVSKRLLPEVKPNSLRGIAMKSIAEKIVQGEADLDELRNQQTEVVKKISETEDDAELQTLQEEAEVLAESITKKMESIESLKRIEKSLAPRIPEGGDGGGDGGGEGTRRSAAIVQRSNLGTRKIDGMNIIRAALCSYEGYIKRSPIDDIIKSRYGNNESVEILTRAAQNPAMTTVPEWAGALVQDTYGAFMDMLAVASVIPQIPMQQYEFGKYHSIKVARRTSRYPAAPNLASAFRGEGAPIRVGAVSLASDSLTPKTAGVIGTFTQELFEQSTPNIETEIRNWIMEDTGIALDTIFLGAGAGSAIEPAGIRASSTGANTAVSTGSTPAQITADIRGRAQQMAATGNGQRPVWIMIPARLAGLELSVTAAGTLAFPSVGQNKTLLGAPIVTSLTVPSDVVYLVDAAALAYAGSAPQFLGTEVATLHEEDTTPLPIVDGAAAPAAPTRSLYQTYSSALRGIYKVDWKVLRPGSVQTITAVAW